MNPDDPLMKTKMEMYEAQAIVIEKEKIIKRLEQEKAELEERVNRERLERENMELKSRVKQLESRIQGEVAAKQFETGEERKLFVMVWKAIENIEEKIKELDTSRIVKLERRLDKKIKTFEEIIRLTEIKQKVGPIKDDTESMAYRQKQEYSTAHKLQRSHKRLSKIYIPHPAESDVPSSYSSSSIESMTENVETILVVGGRRDSHGLDEMLLLDKKRCEWQLLPLTLPCPNSHGGAVCLDEEIFIFGGDGLLDKTYKLDRDRKWIELAKMNERRSDISSSSLVFMDSIWVIGGVDSKRRLKTVERYCLKEKKWLQMPEMTRERQGGAAAAFNEKIFVSGGYNIVGRMKSVECFDPISKIWTPLIDLPSGRNEHSMISHGSSLFVLGGWNGVKVFNNVWKINPEEENSTWKDAQPMKEARRFSSAVSTGKEIFLIGGKDGKMKFKTVEFYDGESWKDGPELPESCFGMSAVVISANLGESLCDNQITPPF